MPIEIREGIINVIVVENPKQMASYVQELIKQTQGRDGSFVLYENSQELTFKGAVKLVMDPFKEWGESKEILTPLISKLKIFATDQDNFMATEEICQHINKYATNLLQKFDTLLEFDQFSASSFLKAISPHFESIEDSLLENICDMITAYSRYSFIRLFIFVNLKSYLSITEIMELYKFTMYNKIQVMLIESHDSNIIEQEHVIIIDNDLCELHKGARTKVFDV